MKNWFSYHYTELEYTNNPMYVLRTADIFPYDWEVNDRVPNTNRVLRPEFVCQYERPLKSDTKKMAFNRPAQPTAQDNRKSGDLTSKRSQKDPLIAKDDEDQNDVMELNEASRVLRRSLV